MYTTFVSDQSATVSSFAGLVHVMQFSFYSSTFEVLFVFFEEIHAVYEFGRPATGSQSLVPHVFVIADGKNDLALKFQLVTSFFFGTKHAPSSLIANLFSFTASRNIKLSKSTIVMIWSDMLE